MVVGANAAILRSLLRELRGLGSSGRCWRSELNAASSSSRAARALLPSDVLNALLDAPKGALYRPSVQPYALQVDAARFDSLWLWVRRRLRRHIMLDGRSEVDFDEDVDEESVMVDEHYHKAPTDHSGQQRLVIAAAGVANTVAQLPLPVCDPWTAFEAPPSSEGSPSLHVVENPANIQAGDYLVGHPTAEGISGCVALVLRHSIMDTLCLLLNVDADDCSDEPANISTPNQAEAMTGYVQSPWHPRRLGRMPRRPHIHLPPLASGDPRQILPLELQSLPIRYGGAGPAPLHLLHDVPLVPSKPQTEAWQRLTGWEVRPGLWCSYVDENVVAVAKRMLALGKATPNNFGAFVGMVGFEPHCLAKSVYMNRWIPVRPLAQHTWRVPPQGWPRQANLYDDDRNWTPWRTIVSNLGVEYAEWANVDWARISEKRESWHSQQPIM